MKRPIHSRPRYLYRTMLKAANALTTTVTAVVTEATAKLFQMLVKSPSRSMTRMKCCKVGRCGRQGEAPYRSLVGLSPVVTSQQSRPATMKDKQPRSPEVGTRVER